ncbi:hypothetical protein [Yoonia maritima]|uniref:hypothetical protein n=1 Tax=Yoonia maritima TaxID=1435347 RepID=UPI000D0F4CF7|nr:hypothetical protein [Yoonia maritima]
MNQTTDAECALTKQEVHELETKIQSGSTDPVEMYFKDAVAHHIDDIDELESRKRIIRMNCGGDIASWQRFGILSALTNDRSGWDATVRVLKGEMPADTGLSAAWHLQKYRPEIADLPEWSVLLDSSVSLGSIAAKIVTFRRRTRKLGLLQEPIITVYRVFQALRAIPIALKNPNDPRLPKE